MLLYLCFFRCRFIGLAQSLEEWCLASSMNSYSINEDISDSPKNPLMEVSLLFYLQRAACKSIALDEKVIGRLCGCISN